MFISVKCKWPIYPFSREYIKEWRFPRRPLLGSCPDIPTTAMQYDVDVDAISREVFFKYPSIDVGAAVCCAL